MRELFSIETDGFLSPLEERGIFEVYHRETETTTYFEISTHTEEEMVIFDECCGDVPDHKINIYDTKTHSYLAKGIPANVLDACCSNAEPEVVLAAIELIPKFDRIDFLTMVS